MPILRFRGELGRRLWGRVKDNLHLIHDAPSIRGLRGEAHRDAEVRLVAFMVAASFGALPISDRRYGSRLERFRFLSRLNPLIYRITYSDTETIFYIEGGSGTQRLSLGHACGFSAVLPLTHAGFDAYMAGYLAAHELAEPHIRGLKASIGESDHLLIAGVSHMPSLLKDRGFDDPKSFRHSTYTVIANLLRQLGDFSPPLSVAADSGDMVSVWGQPLRAVPIVSCFISGAGRGEPLLRRSGFALEGEDKVGNRRYVLRLARGGHAGKVALVKRIIYLQQNP